MNVISKLKFAALAVVLCATMPRVWAQQAIADPSPTVQAMIRQPFNAMTVETRTDGKRYLYVQNEPAQGVSVIDITDPSQPQIVGFLNTNGRWTKSAPAQGDPDAPQNHVEYGG